MRRRLTVLFGMIIALVLFMGVYTALAPPRPANAQSTFAPVQCSTSVAFSSASSAQVVTAGNSNMFVYVCGAVFGSIGGSDFSVVEGTGTTCATGIKAVAGGTTAATGLGLAANGTLFVGSGVGYQWKTAVAGDNLCFIVSGTGPLAGSLITAQESY